MPIISLLEILCTLKGTWQKGRHRTMEY